MSGVTEATGSTGSAVSRRRLLGYSGATLVVGAAAGAGLASVAEAQDKRALGEVLAAAGDAFRAANSVILDELWAIYSTLILRGQAAGLIRPGFDADDVRALLAGAHQGLLVIGDNPRRRQRLLDVLMDGVRATPAG